MKILKRYVMNNFKQDRQEKYNFLGGLVVLVILSNFLKGDLYRLGLYTRRIVISCATKRGSIL